MNYSISEKERHTKQAQTRAFSCELIITKVPGRGFQKPGENAGEFPRKEKYLTVQHWMQKMGDGSTTVYPLMA